MTRGQINQPYISRPRISWSERIVYVCIGVASACVVGIVILKMYEAIGRVVA